MNMKRKLRIYIDTSVVGGCFDEEFAEESNALFEMAVNNEVVLLISSELIAELYGAPEYVRNKLDSLPDYSWEEVFITPEAKILQEEYLKEKILGESSGSDALHVAIATVSKADIIVSWNFKHIVHYDKIMGFNGVNIKEGYNMISIYSPKEVV